MPNLSLLLLTKNEEKNFKEWETWIHKLISINEIVVIDDLSTDNTIKILKSFATTKLSVIIYKRKLNKNFSNQRNFGISKCKNDWIFFLDADEIPSAKTINFINNLSLKTGHNYSFKRNIFYLNHTISHGQCLHDNPIKIFHKKEGKFINPVHEIWQSTATTIHTNHTILHYSIKDINSFLQKINLYSSIRAKELFDKKVKTNIWEIIFYPKLKFINLYFIKLGLLDGIPGLILSLSLSFNSFLVRSKLWHLSQK